MLVVGAALVGCLAAAGSALATPPSGPRGAARAPEQVLFSAPSSGASILIWTHFDGVERKLAWSRMVNGHWSAPRIMTFGPGDDRTPAVGISSAGSFLYWTDGRGRVFYAPFDPETGRLFAVPRPLPAASPVRPGPAPEGGSDVPVILGVCESPEDVPCVGGGSTPPAPINGPNVPQPEGGSDVPITLCNGGSCTTGLTVTSDPDCPTQVLTVALDGQASSYRIDGSGRVKLLGRFVLADGVDEGAASAAASTYYHDQVCE
jgi:hypothetical protein